MHPPTDSPLNLDVYLHVITCDHCTAAWGDARILAYGNTLLQAAIILGTGSN